MRIISIILLLFLLNFISQLSFAQDDARFIQFKQSYLNELYNGSYKKADSIIQKNESEFKSNSSYYLLSANFFWWKIITGDKSKQNENQFFAQLNKSKKLNNRKNNQNVNHIDLRNSILIHAFKTRFEMLDNQYLSAVQDLKNCIDYLKTSFGKEEEYPDFLLTSGLYNYFSDYACEQYTFVRMVFKIYPRGNKHKGLLMLGQATQKSDIFLKTESHYFLMKIYFDLEKDYPKAKINCRALLNLYPENHIYQLYWIHIQKQLNQYEDYKLKVDKFIISVNENKSLNELQRLHLMKELEKITHPN